MRPDVDIVRVQLGELAAMAGQCDEAERRILARASDRLAYVEKQLEATDAGCDVAELVKERGVLEQVIARARQTLGEDPK
ncbi:hypothetical protein [Paraburkholderia phenoliruptrix]|uniref:hypothetical protein n=1 Tax=Paraburkholderia phenoliruptrix TaxID=252970 RepID=UPI0001C02FC7|nr:hypothetical protein [Paraburkholderia phenoliruptrix]MDR6392267.1 hypothetical protein [Paraburkholderia phenoliruptrix]